MNCTGRDRTHRYTYTLVSRVHTADGGSLCARAGCAAAAGGVTAPREPAGYSGPIALLLGVLLVIVVVFLVILFGVRRC